MRILVLNYEYPPLGGGAAPVSRDISVQLARRGHDVTVVTMGFHGLSAYEEEQGVRIYRLKCLRGKKSSCMPWEQYTYLLAVRRFMKNHMKSHTYDICHTHFVIPTGEAARWVKDKYGIPYVITAHGSDVEGYNSKKYMKIMHRFLRPSWRKIVKGSEGVIAPSDYLLSLMKKEYDGGNYIQIPNGLDVKKYSEIANRDKKEKRILLMGRMQKYKNMQTAIRAVAAVHRSGWTVDILGDGPYRGELEQLVSELGLADCVRFHGWIDNNSKEQLAYLQKASVYITASHFENCPMAVLETTAAGCYPLLSDIPGHRQLIGDDQYYFAPDDVQGLANRLGKVMDKEPAEVDCGLDVSRYDWEQIIRRYEDVLQKVDERDL